jgi:mannose-6-phosphate isomerase-like protein (cupin superfamily)
MTADVEVRRAIERFRTDDNGITTFHSFSYGRHYDPANVAFGPVIAINEECVPPGGGYDTHAHRDVDIVTWVLDGALAHEDSTGADEVIGPGELRWLDAADGVRHAERNASSVEPLRFLQVMLRSDRDAVDVTVVTGPTTVTGPALIHALGDGVEVDGTVLNAGDEARLSGSRPYDVDASASAGALVIEVRRA